MADHLRVQRLLRRISDDLSLLEHEARADEARRSDPLWLSGVKYRFVTAIEAAVDIAQHICATEGWGPPSDNGHALRLLGTHGVLNRELAEVMGRAVGFRNVLVHEYVDVDDSVVIERLHDLSDLRSFAREIAEYLEPRV